MSRRLSAIHLGWPYHPILALDHLAASSRHRFSRVDDHPYWDEATLSLELHTLPLPATHVQVGYCWQNNKLHLSVTNTHTSSCRTWPSYEELCSSLYFTQLAHLGYFCTTLESEEVNQIGLFSGYENRVSSQMSLSEFCLSLETITWWSISFQIVYIPWLLRTFHLARSILGWTCRIAWTVYQAVSFPTHMTISLSPRSIYRLDIDKILTNYRQYDIILLNIYFKLTKLSTQK